MKGQLNLFEPEFIKDIDCTIDTPVTRGKKDKPIYGTGKHIKPRVPGRTETQHMKDIYLEELLPLEEYDLIVVLISGNSNHLYRNSKPDRITWLQTADKGYERHRSTRCDEYSSYRGGRNQGKGHQKVA